jgi:formylglycine-generating enzyme required for sulfatase activity
MGIFFIVLFFSISSQLVAQEAPAGFVRVPGGTYLMGSPAQEKERYSNEQQHTVTVDAFYLGIFEVTQKEYRDIVGTNPSTFKGDSLPVEKVSWYDAVEYCNARSRKEGLSLAYTINKSRKDPNNTNAQDTIKWIVTWDRQANGYRLPTEAEWEYACRAGTTSPFYTGDAITTDQANYDGNYPYNGNARGQYRKTSLAVGSLGANAWGLYDMHGNVYEWCWDWYSVSGTAAQSNPIGPATGSGRVLRGGSWQELARDLRSASRPDAVPTRRGNYLGFRIARSR